MTRHLLSALATILAAVFATSALAQADNEATPAFSAIQHAEPNPVGKLAFAVSPSYNFSTEAVALTTGLSITPDVEFLHNSVFGITGPTGFIQDREEGLDTTFTLDWQQRWVKGNGNTPTFGTRVKLLLPTDESRDSVDVRIAAIVTQRVGKGYAYLNGIYESEGDTDGSGIFLATAGYKYIATNRLSLLADVTYEEDGSLFFGVSAGYFGDNWTVGPGIQTEVDTVTGNSSVTGGMLLQYFFF